MANRVGEVVVLRREIPGEDDRVPEVLHAIRDRGDIAMIHRDGCDVEIAVSKDVAGGCILRDGQIRDVETELVAKR